jgi:hypothetical protein
MIFIVRYSQLGKKAILPQGHIKPKAKKSFEKRIKAHEIFKTLSNGNAAVFEFNADQLLPVTHVSSQFTGGEEAILRMHNLMKTQTATSASDARVTSTLQPKPQTPNVLVQPQPKRQISV